MQNRRERRRWPPRPGKRPKANARLVTDAPAQQPDPNKRDESPDSQSSDSHKIMQLAYADVAAGREDTDCRNRAAEIIERQSGRGRRR